MSVDVLQEKIRKTKNPSILELNLSVSEVPAHIRQEENGDGAACARFCRELLEGLKGIVPGVRVSFAAFSYLGHDGLYRLSEVLKAAGEMGYYVLLDAPEILSPAMAKTAAEQLLGENSLYPCDGLVIGGYLGSDVIKPFLPYCKKQHKDIFVVTRTANKSAAELQDLLTGGRVVHGVAADHVNRYGGDTAGKSGYTKVGLLAAASSAESLRSLRAKYPRLFLLLDGYDYPNANARNCSHAFDKFGHGAAACSNGIANAWTQGEGDDGDWMEASRAAAERMKKNMTRYVTVL